MRFVELKSEEQLDLQTLHRVRQRLVGARRTLIDQLRAILFERGHAVAQGRRRLELAVDAMLADPELPLSDRIRALVAEIRAEWRQLDRRIDALNAEFAERARTDDAARRLTQIPGIGVLNATALVAALGDGTAFRRGRDLAAWLGLVPRQHTTGGKPKLLGITKRGNRYLRMLFIHGEGGPTVAGKERIADRRLAARPAGPRPPQCRGGGARQQARAHRVGDPARERQLRSPARRHAGLTRKGVPQSATLRGSAGRGEDGLTVDRRSGSLVQETAHRCRVFHEDRDARRSIMAAGTFRETG